MPKVYIKTFGCQMNVRDSEIILGMLKRKGYKQAKTSEEADIILFNTCSVRQHAEQRLWSNLGMLKEFKKGDSKGSIRTTNNEQYPYGHRRTTKIIGLIGCMAQNYQDEVFRRAPHVDLVCGPANIYDIPNLLNQVKRENRQVLAVNRIQRPMASDCKCLPAKSREFVSIMYGCNNFCSYCIVPYVRGREMSRPVKHILDEIKGLAKRGCKEITLLGQNVNSYKGLAYSNKRLSPISYLLSAKTCDFVQLLQMINDIDGIEKIRFMTSHPKDASEKLFRAMRNLPKVCERLHLPLQAGSDKILKAMNRKYTLKDYLKKIDTLRKLIPNCALSTDIIVGFPGETRTDFQKTVSAMKKIQFDKAFIFKYSPRPKTKAAELADDVPLEIKQQRNQELLKLQRGISLKKIKKITVAIVLAAALVSFAKPALARSDIFKNVEILMLRDRYAEAAEECRKILAKHQQSKIRSKAQYFLEICLLKEKGADPSHFSVQAGCFSEKGNAQKLCKELTAKGFHAYTMQLPGDELYRVRVGKLGSKSEAQALERQLKAKGYPTKICP